MLLADQGLASLDETEGDELRDLARQRGVPEAGDVRPPPPPPATGLPALTLSPAPPHPPPQNP